MFLFGRVHDAALFFADLIFFQNEQKVVRFR